MSFYRKNLCHPLRRASLKRVLIRKGVNEVEEEEEKKRYFFVGMFSLDGIENFGNFGSRKLGTFLIAGSPFATMLDMSPPTFLGSIEAK